MLNSRDYHNAIPVLILVLCNFYTITAAVETNVTTDITTSASASTSSCTPLNCVPACTPNCGIQETCVLRTMTNCAVCPSSQCINRATIGLPPVPTSSQSSASNNGSSNSGLIGGIVGGLAGVGVLIGIGVFCYIKRAKKKRKLPFAFTDGGMGIMSQEKFQSYPPGTAAGTLTQHQNRSVISPASEPTSRYISLSELANNNISPTTMQYRSNLVPPPTPQHNYTNQSTTSVHDVSTVNTNNINHNHNHIHNEEAIYRNSISNNQQINANSSTTSHYTELSPAPLVPAATVPEEFEERIAIQNKRISQILNSNPRLSRGSAFNQPQQPPLPITENRMSGISFTTTDDDSEYDDDDRSVSSTNQPKQAVLRSRSVYQQPQSATQAVQVTRAKAQIMRVNSVRSNAGGAGNGNGGGGLGRSDSVRTILTAVNTPPPTIPQLDLASDSLFTESFPATPNNRSIATLEDPFLDTKK